MPAAAKGDGRAAAKAFVRYYIDLINYAGRTGDVTDVTDLSTTQCTSCSSLAARISDTYASGGYFRGRGWLPISLLVVAQQPPDKPIVQVVVKTSRQEWVKREGGPSEHVDAGRVDLGFHLRVANGAFEIIKLVRS
jgi:hypothetical protein